MFWFEPTSKIRVTEGDFRGGLDVYSEARIVLCGPIFWVEIKTENLKNSSLATALIAGIDAFLNFSKTEEKISRVCVLLATHPHTDWEFHHLHAILQDSRGDCIFKVDKGLRTVYNLEYVQARSQLSTLYWI